MSDVLESRIKSEAKKVREAEKILAEIKQTLWIVKERLEWYEGILKSRKSNLKTLIKRRSK